MEFLINIAFVLFLIGLGLVFGTLSERSHFRRLDAREGANGSFLVTQLKTFPGAVTGPTPPHFLVAECVVATDYFKSFLASLRGLFGGEVRSYQSLLSRARREATQQIVEQAKQRGYNAICNLRVQTADIGGNTATKKGAAMVAIMASATAYHRQEA